MKPTQKKIYWIYTILNLAVLLDIILLILERSKYRNAFSDYGAPLGMFALAIIMPICFFVIWTLHRKRQQPYTPAERRYYKISQVLLTMFWVPAFSVLLLISSFFIAIIEPWPLSLRQGPDTKFAREMFEKRMRIAPSQSIQDLYCRTEWMGFGDGSSYRFMFNYKDPQIINQLVEQLNLEPYSIELNKPSWPVEASHPKWWPKKEDVKIDEVYGWKISTFDPEGVIILKLSPVFWVDQSKAKAYFYSWLK